jgi:hypothetical protein
MVMSLLHAMRAHMRDQRGQTFVEYALILAVVVVVGVLLASRGDWAMRSRRRCIPSRELSKNDIRPSGARGTGSDV